MAELIDMPFGKGKYGWALETTYYMGVHMGATWQIRLNYPCLAVM